MPKALGMSQKRVGTMVFLEKHFILNDKSAIVFSPLYIWLEN
jgi:hypothetical protein